VEGRGTYTPFVRGRQFAAIAAAQAAHKVSLRGVGEVDAEIVRLLRVAYEQNV
jgi:hypothetical protein